MGAMVTATQAGMAIAVVIDLFSRSYFNVLPSSQCNDCFPAPRRAHRHERGGGTLTFSKFSRRRAAKVLGACIVAGVALIGASSAQALQIGPGMFGYLTWFDRYARTPGEKSMFWVSASGKSGVIEQLTVHQLV